MRSVPSIARMIRSSVWGRSRTLGSSISSRTLCRSVAVMMTRSPTRQPVTGSARVTADRSLLGGGAELDPGAAQRAAVNIPSAAATDDRRAFLRIKPRARPPAGSGPCDRRRSADPACRFPGRARGRVGSGAVTWFSQSKPDSLASSPAWILISPTSRRVSRSGSKRRVPATWIDRIGAVGLRVEGDHVPRADLNPRPAAGNLSPLPGRRVGPSTVGDRTNQRNLRVIGRLTGSQYRAQECHRHQEDAIASAPVSTTLS